MMPYNSLALLAILALGCLWLLSGQMTLFVSLTQTFVGHALLIGFFFLFIRYTTGTEEKLTRTIIQNPLSSFNYPNEVCVPRSNQVLHQCTYCCHRNFDNNTCPLLCGDHYIHPNCNNCCRPDLSPPPEIPNRLASLPLNSTSASLPFLQQYTSLDQHPYGLLHAIMCSQCIRRPSPCPFNSHQSDRVDGAHLSFDKLVNGLEGYIVECQANGQCCHRLANRHDICQRVCEDARSPPVQCRDRYVSRSVSRLSPYS